MFIKGDTVFRYKWRDRYRDKLIHDSIFIQDTIKVPYPVEVIVKVNELHWWQESLMWFGVGALILIVMRLIKSRIKK